MTLFAAGMMTGLLGSAMIGGALGVLVWWIIAAFTTEDLEQADEWRFDVSRMNALRRLDTSYRLFQPVIQFFAKFNRAAFRERLPEVQREILAAGLPRYWLPEEYLARTQLTALLLTPVYLYLSVRMMGVSGYAVFMAAMLSVGTAWMLRRRLTQLAQKRLVAIKRRMPFLLDLLTLLMDAGLSFLQALKQSVVEFEGHPVANEFGRVLSDMNMGRVRTEAFNNMRQRLNDDEISGIIGAIIQGEELGTPLTEIFRTQADVLRIKRTQRAETIAGEAGVNMLLPGILVMAACVLVILGPFILGYMRSGFF